MKTHRGGAAAPTLAIVGAGRAGSALAIAARDAGYAITAVASRSESSARALAEATGARVAATPLDAVSSAALTLVTVPDGALIGVAATIAATGAALHGRVVAHTAARHGAGVLAALRQGATAVGVLHPMQALSGGQSAAALRGAWFRVEGDQAARAELLPLVGALAGHELVMDAPSRDLYHAAAVLAGNAPLALLARATDLLVAAGAERGAAHAALATLLAGAAQNARAQGPEAALTGPVVRGDGAAIAAHVEALRKYPEALALYTTLTTELRRLAVRGTSDTTMADVA